MIHEVIVTTINENERVHIAPMGIKFVDHADKKCVHLSNTNSYMNLKVSSFIED